MDDGASSGEVYYYDAEAGVGAGLKVSHPLVVHCKKARHDVYIGRPSKWGNKFVIGPDGTREEVIRKYEAWVKTQPALMAALGELRGKVLGCWCAPLACHGDVLAKLANQEEA